MRCEFIIIVQAVWQIRLDRSTLPANCAEKVDRDAAGSCKIVTLAEVEARGWNLNPGRYVGESNVNSLRILICSNAWKS